MKHFCYISSFSLYTTKNTTNSLPTTYTNTQKSYTTQENGLETKLHPPKKRDFGREKVLFSPFLPLKSLRNTGAEQSSIAHSRLHCVRFFRRKTRFFRWRYTPSVERSTTMSKNSSAFYAEQTTFRQKSSSFLTKWPRGKRAPPTLYRNNVGGVIAS